MNPITRWRDRRDQEWWDRFHREHRWDRLGAYNAERARGIVHTPEWDAAMADEQARFDEEHGNVGQSIFPFALDPGTSVELTFRGPITREDVDDIYGGVPPPGRVVLEPDE